MIFRELGLRRVQNELNVSEYVHLLKQYRDYPRYKKLVQAICPPTMAGWRCVHHKNESDRVTAVTLDQRVAELWLMHIAIYKPFQSYIRQYHFPRQAVLALVPTRQIDKRCQRGIGWDFGQGLDALRPIDEYELVIDPRLAEVIR